MNISTEEKIPKNTTATEKVQQSLIYGSHAVTPYRHAQRHV